MSEKEGTAGTWLTDNAFQEWFSSVWKPGVRLYGVVDLHAAYAAGVASQQAINLAAGRALVEANDQLTDARAEIERLTKAVKFLTESEPESRYSAVVEAAQAFAEIADAGSTEFKPRLWRLRAAIAALEEKPADPPPPPKIPLDPDWLK